MRFLTRREARFELLRATLGTEKNFIGSCRFVFAADAWIPGASDIGDLQVEPIRAPGVAALASVRFVRD